MAQGVSGSVLDEPAHPTRRERRQKSRPDARSRRGKGTPDPEGRDGGAGARQARRAREERRRFWLVLMPAVAVLLAVVVGFGALIRANDDTGTTKAARAGTAGATHTGSTLLIGHRGADGRIDVLMLVGATRRASSVLLLPVATQVEVPSLGPQVLADLANEGGTGLLQTTIENVLGVDVGKTVMFDDATLNAALAAAAPLPVDLHRSVDFAGSADPAVPAGAHKMATGEAARLLVAQQPGSELDRLVTVQDVMDGWLQRLRNPSVARRTAALQPALAGLVAASKPSDRRTDTLPVESVATGGSERFGARAGDVRRYVQSAFPDALLNGGARRPRVEVLNGTGAVGLAQTIAGRIVPAGGQVTLTGNVTNFGLKDTQVVYYESRDRAAAQRMLHALGCGTLKSAETPIGVVDVTILAGADCFRTGTTPGP